MHVILVESLFSMKIHDNTNTILVNQSTKTNCDDDDDKSMVK